MNGFQITFFTEQSRKHGHQPLHGWLLQVAKSLGIEGGTSIVGAEGQGRSGHLHVAHLFSLGEQPVEVTMAMSEEQVGLLFARLEQEKINIFYVKSPVEYGIVGGAVPRT